MHGKLVEWFQIYVQDMHRAKTFYEIVFEAKLRKWEHAEFDAWSFPLERNICGSAGALVKMPGRNPGSDDTLVYFSCADCADEAARAQQAGGTIFREKFRLGQNGFVALITDTEGNLIGLHSMR